VPVNEFGQPVGRPVPGWTPRPPIDPVVLEGRHVRLEPLTADHVDVLHRPMVTDSPPSTWTYYPYPDLTDRAAFAHEYVDALLALPAALPMAILRPDGAGLGVACFLRIDPANGSAEVGGIVMSAALQRTTAATEAMVLMARHVFEDLGYRRWEWKCDSCNEPSRRAAVRLGFTYEGRFRNATVYRGRNRDTDWFSITDDEWRLLAPAYDAWLAEDNFAADGRQRCSLTDLTARALTGLRPAQSTS
jgi:RimJ/RimL family protein N-acetyltransferase